MIFLQTCYTRDNGSNGWPNKFVCPATLWRAPRGFTLISPKLLEKEDAYINRNATIFCSGNNNGNNPLPQIRRWLDSVLAFKYTYLLSFNVKELFQPNFEFFTYKWQERSKTKSEPGYDRLYNIYPLITSLISNFQASYKPGCELSIDEAIVSFKGRIWFLQYMPKKQTNRG